MNGAVYVYVTVQSGEGGYGGDEQKHGGWGGETSVKQTSIGLTVKVMVGDEDTRPSCPATWCN